ncbi:hypothetical protein [Plantactinospora sp. KBS50]|uniref:hypothetical protein n=1 Tax=Plantactinospora sp. KBS50 TaxID=2024580 RepID=UPI000BAAD3A8|nr:hypothetical protein [Plantactinospora sp. KBS50]ASW53907.1 hypothetical protein CIK06_06520 [Plantactinospora sp. KBS50]
MLAGVAAGGYGLALLRPQFGTAGGWLLAGPVLHDAVLAPLAGLAGLALARLVPRPAVRWWLRGGLVVTGTLLLVALPLVWRPAAAPPNPGLQDRDYLHGLAVWLAALWIGVALAVAVARWPVRRNRRSAAATRRGGTGGRAEPPVEGQIDQ